MSTTSDLLDLDATGQADLVRRGDITPVDLVRASMDAIERLDPGLDAFLHRAFDYALTAAEQPVELDAPFCGVPAALKDLGQELADFPYSYGALPFLREKPLTSDHETYLAGAMRKAGFVFLGRTNTSLAGMFFPTHDVAAHTMPRNPWNPDYSTGGSSSGSAAAVAARLVAVAHGNDSGGSIRIPASMCGLVGLKATRGRVSVGPDRTEVMSFGRAWGHEFVVTRSVRDTATLLDVVQGWRPGDSLPVTPSAVKHRGAPFNRPLRIGLTTTPFMAGSDCDTECAAAAENAGLLLQELGHHVDPVEPPRYDFASAAWDYGMSGGPAMPGVTRYIDRLGTEVGRPLTLEDLGPQLWAAVEWGRNQSALQLLEFGEFIHRHVVAWDEWWRDSGLDILLSPTMALTTPHMEEFLPPPHGIFELPEDRPLSGLAVNSRQIAFNQIYNWSGQPAISLPLAMGENNLPLGVQLAAARMDDDLLLQLSFQLEEARPWSGRRPAVCA